MVAVVTKAVRIGSSTQDIMALDALDEFLDEHRDALAAHLTAIAALDEAGRQSYDLTQGWPEEG